MDITQERKILTQIPGPRSKELMARRDGSMTSAFPAIHPIVTARASGAIVEDVDGNRLIDFATGIAVLNVGHSAPDVIEAARRQLELDTHTSGVAGNEPTIELAERLNALTPGDFPKKTFFANSGAEAVENAVKIARYSTGRQAIVCFDHAFHGRTQMAMTLTAKVMPYKQGFGPFAPEVYRLPMAYPYRWPSGPERCAEEALAYALDEMHKHIGEQNIAGVLIEPIQGEGGFIVPAPGFLKGLADFCAEHGIVFIADEIQSGMGRAGRWYAIEDEEGVVPDIVLTAKSLGAGFPISAVTGRATSMDAIHPGGLGGTYGGNPVAAAAALAVLDKIEREGLLERSRALGDTIMARFRGYADRYPPVGDVRGRGAMCAIELVVDRRTKEPLGAEAMNAIVRRCLENGVIVLTAGTYGNVIRLLPPLTIEDALLEDGLRVLDDAIGAALG
jgi:4-aminobutyrate aminotransferase/(S)-3-amino-2-methylpropionate transaminase